MSRFVAETENKKIEFDHKPTFKEYVNTVFGLGSVKAEDVPVILKQINGEEAFSNRIAKAKLKEIV